MDYITKMLENLENIVTEPNRNGGIWVSFKLFIKFSDDLLKNKELLKTSPNYREQSEKLIIELESIRKNFTKEFGFELGNYGQSPKFNTMKNGQQSHKFKKRISEFLKSYKGKFIGKFKRCEEFFTPFNSKYLIQYLPTQNIPYLDFYTFTGFSIKYQ